MKILAIDTAGWTCSVALWEDGHELAFQEIHSDRGQAALLPQLVKEVIDAHTIDQLIVNTGPGSFTGIRLGIAFAKGLSMGLSLPLRGIDSFTATYLSLDSQDDVLILIESRRQDVFGQWFRNGKPENAHCYTLQDIEKILLISPPPLFAGSGVPSFLQGLTYKEASIHRRGAQQLAHAFFKSPELLTEPLPYYVRDADVTYAQKACP